MKKYTITLTLSVDAETEAEALEEFDARLEAHDFDGDSIEVEEEAE